MARKLKRTSAAGKTVREFTARQRAVGAVRQVAAAVAEGGKEGGR